MARHDQLFKDLIRAFFADFLRLVDPDIAAELQLEDVSFQDKESFTDLPEGKRTEADLVARVPTLEDQGRLVLTHIEVERRASRQMGRRLYRYFLQLQLRHGLPVLPIVVFMRGGRAGVTAATHVETVVNFRVCEFHYLAFGLSSSPAEDYVARLEPLAWALAALMKPRSWSRPRLKLECLKRIARAEVDPARKFLLVNCLETYIQLDQRAAAEYETLLRSEPENQEVIAMEMTWADKLEARGEARGRLLGMQQLLLHLLEQRFGPLPESVRKRIGAMKSTRRLNTLAEKVFQAQRLEDLGLGV